MHCQQNIKKWEGSQDGRGRFNKYCEIGEPIDEISLVENADSLFVYLEWQESDESHVSIIFPVKLLTRSRATDEVLS